jgi:hypothetical protein
MPRWVSAWIILTITSMRLGRQKEAHEAVQHLLRLSPTFSISRRPRTFRDDDLFKWTSDLLRQAGILE